MSATGWVYISNDPSPFDHNGVLYTVGFYDPEGEFHPDSDHESRDSAAARVHYLNGGITAKEK